jgi:hypothetical protein
MNGHSDAFGLAFRFDAIPDARPVPAFAGTALAMRYVRPDLTDYLETKIGPGKPGPKRWSGQIVPIHVWKCRPEP